MRAHFTTNHVIKYTEHTDMSFTKWNNSTNIFFVQGMIFLFYFVQRWEYGAMTARLKVLLPCVTRPCPTILTP